MGSEIIVSKADLKQVVDHFDRRIDALVEQVKNLAQHEANLVRASNSLATHVGKLEALDARLEQRFTKVEKQVAALHTEIHNADD